MKKIKSKEYIPNSKAFKVIYEDGGVGYGADPDMAELIDGMRESSRVASLTRDLPKKAIVGVHATEAEKKALEEQGYGDGPEASDEDLLILKGNRLMQMGFGFDDLPDDVKMAMQRKGIVSGNSGVDY
jgi:hypothetical protein